MFFLKPSDLSTGGSHHHDQFGVNSFDCSLIIGDEETTTTTHDDDDYVEDDNEYDEGEEEEEDEEEEEEEITEYNGDEDVGVVVGGEGVDAYEEEDETGMSDVYMDGSEDASNMMLSRSSQLNEAESRAEQVCGDLLTPTDGYDGQSESCRHAKTNIAGSTALGVPTPIVITEHCIVVTETETDTPTPPPPLPPPPPVILNSSCQIDDEDHTCPVFVDNSQYEQQQQQQTDVSNNDKSVESILKASKTEIPTFTFEMPTVQVSVDSQKNWVTIIISIRSHKL